jgi:hypothetical protein
MLEKHQPEKWFFGHYHVSKTFKVPGLKTEFRCLGINEPYILDIGVKRKGR